MSNRKDEKNLCNEFDRSMEEINHSALVCLEEDKRDEAFKLLRKNYPDYPCLKTAYNLAYFYFKFGEKNTDNRWYPNLHKTIELLKSAEKYDEDLFVLYSLLGHAYYQTVDYRNAFDCFKKAYMLNQTSTSLINYAFLSYLTKDIKAAEELFSHAHLQDEGNIYMYYCALFCKIVLTDKMSDRFLFRQDILSLLKQSYNYDISVIDDIDIIYLFFLIEDFKKVIGLYDSIFDAYLIGSSDFHIIAYSLHRLNRDDEIEKIL